MNDITTLSNYSITDVIVLLGIIFSSCVGIYNMVKKIMAILEEYRLKRNSIENKDKDINNKIKELENKIIEDREKIKNLNDEIERFREEINSIKADMTKVNKVTSRNAVYKLANELIAKQWMSQSESETLQELCEIFMKTGTTNYVIPSVIQRALNLPVLTEEEIELKLASRKANGNGQ